MFKSFCGVFSKEKWKLFLVGERIPGNVFPGEFSQWKSCQSLCCRHVVAAAWKAELMKQPASCRWDGWRHQLRLCSAVIPHQDSTSLSAIPVQTYPPKFCFQIKFRDQHEDQERLNPILPWRCWSPRTGGDKKQPQPCRLWAHEAAPVLLVSSREIRRRKTLSFLAEPEWPSQCFFC